ncbi:MAG TPA: PTS sugar transporter subunit IIA [Spirochaetota bacterium]|jgi:mannitol/fructose-specific phosphotransferase system IIA component (Ntr-type)|nr:MAG: PTS system fructose-specific EIIABC component [Spirochaetes bacterium ADurb.Bin133]HNZ27188.1 PTS sugar transporter subunit IIA [Spirochaetota bacterium]HPY88343.1 PTS sugar transporter subunit IIA [Spirochaetota bacterium]HQB60242.1 PTS sugar transporter subunit IIA [Spirochaetota bacterium]
MTPITELFNTENIKIVEQSSYDETLSMLLDILKNSEKIKDFEKFKSAIYEREEIISTGIGLGLAIPHARRDFISDFAVSAVIINKGIDWKSIDDKPVKMAVMVASPANSHKEYLNLLSRIVLMWKNTGKRKRIIAAQTSEEILDALKDI